MTTCKRCGRVTKHRVFCSQLCSRLYNLESTHHRKYVFRNDPSGFRSCSHCREMLPLSEFWSTLGYCKKCAQLYIKERAQIIKRNAVEFLGGKCSKCGYNKTLGALDIHHPDPALKEISWTKLKGKSWPRVKKAIQECILLCANCHREEHFKDIQEYEFFDVGTRLTKGDE